MQKTDIKIMQPYKMTQRGIAHIAGVAIVFVGFAIVGMYLLMQSHANPVVNDSGAAAASANAQPNGVHYDMNVIGVPKGKTAVISSGKRIFVPISDNCQINLSPGSYDVQDNNCSDKTPADFQLPNPDPDSDGVTSYSVWVRPVGTPAGKLSVTTCSSDKASKEDVCSLESSIYVHSTGKTAISNVSLGLQTVQADTDGDPSTPPERISIFDDRLQDYLWSLDDQGLRVLQIRYYQNGK